MITEECFSVDSLHSKANPFSGIRNLLRQKWRKVLGETTRPPVRNKSELTPRVSIWASLLFRVPVEAGFQGWMNCALPTVKYSYSLSNNSSCVLSPSLFLFRSFSRYHSFILYKAW